MTTAGGRITSRTRRRAEPLTPAARPVPRLWPVAWYVLMLVGAVGLFLLIRAYGETLAPPTGTGAAFGRNW